MSTVGLDIGTAGCKAIVFNDEGLRALIRGIPVRAGRNETKSSPLDINT